VLNRLSTEQGINTSAPKLPLVAISIYLLAVVVCIFLAFDFAGAINFNWTLVLIGLTLPWSSGFIVFAWTLIHAPGLDSFAFMYLAFAGLNSFISIGYIHYPEESLESITTRLQPLPILFLAYLLLQKTIAIPYVTRGRAAASLPSANLSLILDNLRREL